MTVTIKVKGLGKTEVYELFCPNCEVSEDDPDVLNDLLSIKNGHVTFEGIIVTVKCPFCEFNYIPDQKREIFDRNKLSLEVIRDFKNKNSISKWDRDAVQAELDLLNCKREG